MKKSKNEVRVHRVKKDTKETKDNSKREQSNAFQDPFENHYDGEDHIIAPPINLESLANLYEISNILPQCVTAMEQNCEGFGHNFLCEVPEDEKKKYEAEIEKERKNLKRFFKYINYEISFTKLRKELRKDLEVTGNAYIEILRNEKGNVSGFNRINAVTMRLTSLDEKYTEVKMKMIDEDTFTYDEVKYDKRFRKFVQIVSNTENKVFFKEFGDPRNINMYDGKLQTTDQENGMGAKYREANEIIHIKINNLLSPYGLPRHIGNINSIIGSRNSEEVNAAIFEDPTPHLIFLVAGGYFGEDAVQMIEDYMNYKMKGSDKYHKALILEAVSAENADPNNPEDGKVKIDIKELDQLKDQLFGDYDEKNRKKVRGAYRLPDVYVGENEDNNYASVKVMKEIAEEQIFGPEKQDFDFMINRKIFPEIGARFHSFQTKSAPIDNRKEQAEILEIFSRTGLTVTELRTEIAKIIDIMLEEIPEDLEGQPLVTLPVTYGKDDPEGDIVVRQLKALKNRILVMMKKEKVDKAV